MTAHLSYAKIHLPILSEELVSKSLSIPSFAASVRLVFTPNLYFSIRLPVLGKIFLSCCSRVLYAKMQQACYFAASRGDVQQYSIWYL